jgi:hypothetical protein
MRIIGSLLRVGIIGIVDEHQPQRKASSAVAQSVCLLVEAPNGVMIVGRSKSFALDSAIIAGKAPIKIICPQIGRSKSFASDPAIIAQKAQIKIICLSKFTEYQTLLPISGL